MPASLRAALALLTRIPVGRPPMIIDTFGAHDAESVNDHVRGRRGVGAEGWFPLVGALVGGIGVLTWVAADSLVGPVAAAMASVLATIAVTGALHEDGLADTADGLFGGSTPERRLEIMRDSRLGTFGALALVGELLLRTALLVPLDMPDIARALVAGHVLGRAAPLILVSWLSPVRRDGLGATAIGAPGRREAQLAGLTVAVVALVAAGPYALLLLGVAAAAVFAVGRLAQRRIGGFTGDILGAAVLIVNLVVTGCVAALVNAGWL